METVTYYARTAGDATVYYTADDTLYADGTSSSAQTTSYGYVYYSGTVRVASVTETLATGDEDYYHYTLRVLPASVKNLCGRLADVAAQGDDAGRQDAHVRDAAAWLRKVWSSLR